MNVVLDDASEVYLKEAKPSREIGIISFLCPVYVSLTKHMPAIGRILLKGDNITLIQAMR